MKPLPTGLVGKLPPLVVPDGRLGAGFHACGFWYATMGGVALTWVGGWAASACVPLTITVAAAVVTRLPPAPPVPPPLPPPPPDGGRPSSTARSPVRLPTGACTALPGVAPAAVVTCQPGRVTVSVKPWPLTTMLRPKAKVEVVRVAVTSNSAMPPRTPMVDEGVVTVMALCLLMRPPTRRNTPAEAEIRARPPS